MAVRAEGSFAGVSNSLSSGDLVAQTRTTNMMAPGAFGAPPAPAPTLSAEQVLEALQEVDVLLAQESSMEQLNAARAAAGTDPMMAMMMVRLWQDKPVSRGRRRMLETEDASLLRAWRVPGAFQQHGYPFLASLLS